MQSHLELWNLTAIWIQMEPLLGPRVLYFEQITGQTQEVSSKQSKIIYLKRIDCQGRKRKVQREFIVQSALLRPGLDFWSHGVGCLTYLSAKFPFICSICFMKIPIQWVDASFRVWFFFRTQATVVDLWILQSGSALAPVMQAGFGLKGCSVLSFANFHFIH